MTDQGPINSSGMFPTEDTLQGQAPRSRKTPRCLPSQNLRLVSWHQGAPCCCHVATSSRLDWGLQSTLKLLQANPAEGAAGCS
ncbi:hypothetical protein VTI28DRAFT_2331 [Corynascus sepedonium]